MDDEATAGRGGQLAWATALEASVRGVYRYLGWPEDADSHNVKQHHQVSWEATAAFSAGLVALAEEAERYGLTWNEVVALARAEQHEIERHVRQLASGADLDAAH